ncbi:type I-U CRISPR-associated protein Csb2 [Geitlerinema sp. PCC 7407]|uniref:type I-G CRISPR-associated protein Csb2 n=1 Tax=Geitlerinema sp. PCC 7407 TaxID=1173025 RepID=UPI00029FCE37|nr:type I-U CRISPR-associated protein Csb2 [Geitlerinema sp. PCC 7407]AFY66361.1 CRISPR-associated protein, GSU0054 [Geitlerinema sp. PCC 7407]
MIGLSIQFLTGRYHATPWNHQVNEGQVEWPPSPWRILRSLVFAYYHLPEQPERSLFNQILSKLSNHLPSYRLPAYVAAHTRHYMPVFREGKSTTTKVLDTFYALPGGALSSEAKLWVMWPGVEATEEEKNLLRRLCGQISYLGRAESWVEIQLLSSQELEAEQVSFQMRPLAEPESSGQGEPVRVLAPLTTEGLEGFRGALALMPKPKRGKAKWKIPADLLEVLELDTSDLYAQGWSGIPGARWVTYGLEPVAEPDRLAPSAQRSRSLAPTVARFALWSSVLPNLTEALTLGDRFHKTLTSLSNGDQPQSAEAVFSGRQWVTTEEGEEVEQEAKGHQHAWYLPEPNRQGKIDHVLVYAAGGFSERAIATLGRLRYFNQKEQDRFQMVLVSLGRAEEYRSNGPGVSPLLGWGRRWRSLTPMVLPRHPKFDRRNNPKCIGETPFQREGPEDQALYLLKNLLKSLHQDESLEGCEKVQSKEDGEEDWLRYVNAQGKELVKVRCLSDDEKKACSDDPSKHLHWKQFRRRRYSGEGSRSSECGYWLELEFAEPRQGPIALGYGAHFGLGVFLPVDGGADRGM